MTSESVSSKEVTNYIARRSGVIQMKYELSHLDLHACDHYMGPGLVAQLVASLTADPGVVSLIPACSLQIIKNHQKLINHKT